MRRKRILTLIAGLLGLGFGLALESSPTHAAGLTMTIGRPNNGQATDENGLISDQKLIPNIANGAVATHYYIPVGLEVPEDVITYSVQVQASSSALTAKNGSIPSVGESGEILGKLRNQWGYRSLVCNDTASNFCDADEVNAFTNNLDAIYRPMGTTTPDTIINEETVSETVHQHLLLDFGTGVTGSLPEGDYTTTVTITAIATPDSVAMSNAAFFLVTKMQDMTSEICDSVPTPHPTAKITTDTAPGAVWLSKTYVPTTTLTDSRDGKSYFVSKLADGNCWMTQNLELDFTNTKGTYSSSTSSIATLTGTTFKLTNQDTDLHSRTEWTPSVSAKTVYQTQSVSGSNLKWGASGGVDGLYSFSSSAAYAATNEDCSTATNLSTTGSSSFGLASCTAEGVTAHQRFGNLYNWYAATAGTGNASVKGHGATASSSICPKGWKLPTGGPSGQFNTLYTNSSYNDYVKFDNAWHGAIVGFYNESGLGYSGLFTVWWSRTLYDTSHAYYLGMYNNSFVPADGSYLRYNGLSIRCVLAS